MADYTPIHLPGHSITLTAGAAITGGQVVHVTGVNTVGPAAAASIKTVGVAAHDAASGAKVVVVGGRVVHETTAQGAVTAGDLLKVGTVAGSVAAIGAGTYDQAVGVALTTAADGALVRWMAR